MKKKHYSYQVITILDIHKTVQHCFYLVGGIPTSEKYEFISWDDEIPSV